MAILKIENVSKQYENAESKAVDKCSLSIEEGAFISVEGMSGTGKSTLLMMAAGLLAPTEGKISCDGKDIYKLSDAKLSKWRASTVGYLYQNVQFVQALTVKENMILSGKLGNNPYVNVDLIIKMLSLEKEADKLPSHLSGGQKRRAMMGCVMAREPKLILADEPTNDLDAFWAEKIMNYLKAYTERGNAVVLVTHDKRWTSLATERYEINEGHVKPLL